MKKCFYLSYQKAVEAKDKAQKNQKYGMGQVGPVGGHPWQLNKNVCCC